MGIPGKNYFNPKQERRKKRKQNCLQHHDFPPLSDLSSSFYLEKCLKCPKCTKDSDLDESRGFFTSNYLQINRNGKYVCKKCNKVSGTPKIGDTLLFGEYEGERDYGDVYYEYTDITFSQIVYISPVEIRLLSMYYLDDESYEYMKTFYLISLNISDGSLKVYQKNNEKHKLHRDYYYNHKIDLQFGELFLENPADYTNSVLNNKIMIREQTYGAGVYDVEFIDISNLNENFVGFSSGEKIVPSMEDMTLREAQFLLRKRKYN